MNEMIRYMASTVRRVEAVARMNTRRLSQQRTLNKVLILAMLYVYTRTIAQEVELKALKQEMKELKHSDKGV